jgi:hypothetical protein
MRCTPSGSRPKLAGSSRPPSYTDYGLREGRHVDPEGNAIPYGSPLPGSDRTPDGSILLAADDPLAVAATTAVQAGDLDTLTRLLDDNPELAAARIGDDTMSRTLLHAATDWPDHFPGVGQVIAALVLAGADVNARFNGSDAETPLHWAASSDDLEALDALIDAGAALEAPSAVLGGGSPGRRGRVRAMERRPPSRRTRRDHTAQRHRRPRAHGPGRSASPPTHRPPPSSSPTHCGRHVTPANGRPPSISSTGARISTGSAGTTSPLSTSPSKPTPPNSPHGSVTQGAKPANDLK